MKTPLENLSRSLLKVHSTLLDVEKQLQEEKDGERMSPSTLLQNCINNPGFGWLRHISGTISDIDELAGEQENIDDEMYQRLQNLFVHPEVKEKIQLALDKNPHFTVDLAVLKSQIGSVK